MQNSNGIFTKKINWAPRYLRETREGMSYLWGDMSFLMEETYLGGMSIKWQNSTDQQIDT
jgi:hypothetical protein